ncbi:hypothetical protein VTN49DRAFT_676 [Thermomyces lanuginosus]|uniref:uncharacterized protein n=1 Tax=Thermomyces lanuginosus TaxID=5541 RepID=UPI0037426CA3
MTSKKGRPRNNNRQNSDNPNNNNNRKNDNNKNKNKKPPLTHFLCFPLINETSLPQLAASLARFRANLPVAPQNGDNAQDEQQLLFPPSAVRPLGTLHLTLGVMSLTTDEKLAAARELLESLDMRALMREAGKRAITGNATEEVLEEDAVLRPISVSLEALHALPRQRAATVLYAKPVDRTQRLHALGVLLRDKFLEAGLLEGEYQKAKTETETETAAAPAEAPPATACSDNPLPEADPVAKDQDVEDEVAEEEAEDEEEVKGEAAQTDNNTLHESLPQSDVAQDSVTTTTAAVVAAGNATHAPPKKRRRNNNRNRNLKPRPLLLHATIVNTIYARREGKKNSNSNNNDNNDYKEGNDNDNGENPRNNHRRDRGGRRITFDATPVVAHYGEYYADEARTIVRPYPPAVLEVEAEAEAKVAGYPFVWAEDIPIDRVCLCEMGAKNVDGEDELEDGAPRLGQEYRVVAERRLVIES